MVDLHPALVAVQTMHPRARGAILILHDEDGSVQMNLAAFDVAGSEAHYEEIKALLELAPAAAQHLRDSVVSEAKARAKADK